jgi:ABC-2 type transport system ATP-binding protein
MATKATLRLSRPGPSSNAAGGGRSWKVLIDGNDIGSISKGESIDLEVEPGPHTIGLVSRGILRSPAVPFEAVDGLVAQFSARARPSHPFIVQRSVIFLFISLFKHDVWIKLTPGSGLDGDDDAMAAPRRQIDVDPAPRAELRDPDATASDLRAAAAAVMRTSTVAPTEAALVVSQLTKRFGTRTAFSEVSFDVAHGEVFGFLGPNGAGKTTTVRTLGTMIAPTSGSATIAGIPLRAENGVEIRQHISIMPEAPGLYLRLSVRENLEYFAGLYGLHDPGSRIDAALEAVNLSDRAADLCGGLSKGLRQRVGLARTLLSDPAIMFLDEPTSGLDPVAAREVHELIISLRQRGVTIFITTHRLDEAEKLCDRVAILNTTLRTVGTPAELRAQLFKSAIIVETLKPLPQPDQVFAAITGVESWRTDEGGHYVLAVSDPRVTAPEVTRALVEAGADVLSIGEAQHSLEDVYLELIDEDVEARRT